MSEKLKLDRAKEILHRHVREPHLIAHAVAVSSAMGSLAGWFGGDREHWMAIGYLHDVDYEAHPEEHLKYAAEILRAEGISEEDIRAVLSHGWGICTDVEPVTELEKSLYAADELTGIIQACARMRPLGITDLTVKSAMKKFKDKSFAAKCDRALITGACDKLGMELAKLMELCIEGMKTEAEALGLLPKE